MGRLIDRGGHPGRWVRALVVVLLAGALVSCAGGAGSTSTTTAAVSASGAGTAGAQRGVTGPRATPLSGGNNAIDGAWFVDSNDGWVIGKRCGSGTGATQTCTGAIIHTTDGGKTWTDQSFREVLPCKIQFLDGQNGWIIGVYGPKCDGQQMQNAVVLGTNDGGAHWTERYLSGLLITDLAFTTPDSGWVFAQTCSGSKQVPGCLWQLIQTADGGHTWQQTVLPLKAANIDVSRPTAQDGWVVDRGPVGPGSSSATLIATHDGGHTWSPIKDPAGAQNMAERIDFIDADHGWLLAGGEPGAGNQLKTLYGSSDGGKSWTKLAASPSSMPGAGYVGPLSWPTTQNGWIELGRYGLLYTDDGGHQWGSSFLNPDNSAFASDGSGTLRFTDQLHGWAQGTHNVWLTSDGGIHWHPIFPTA